MVAVLFAQTSLSAVVYRAPSDYAQLIDTDHIEARSETFNPGNNTQLLEARKGGGAADIIGDAITGIITGIQDGINKDKEVRDMYITYFVNLALFPTGAQQVHARPRRQTACPASRFQLDCLPHQA